MPYKFIHERPVYLADTFFNRMLKARLEWKIITRRRNLARCVKQ